jgi:hypothetical protein
MTRNAIRSRMGSRRRPAPDSSLPTVRPGPGMPETVELVLVTKENACPAGATSWSNEPTNEPRMEWPDEATNMRRLADERSPW